MSDHPKIGEAMWYIDERRGEHLALVTAVWGQPGGKEMPAVNLTYVSENDQDRDPYGRALIRKSSVVFVDNQPAGANFWDFLDGDDLA